MSKVKQAVLVVKIVIAIAACIVGYMFYQNYSASQERINAQKKVDKLFNDDKWTEAIEAYKGFIQKYPEKKGLVSNRIAVSLQNMANDKSIKAMGIPKNQTSKKTAANREVIKLLDEAKEYGNLTEMSYIILCEAYIECHDYNKAKAVISEAKTRSNIQPDRFTVQQRRIEQLLKKK